MSVNKAKNPAHQPHNIF